MSDIKVVSHIFDKQQACETAILEDSHGRKHQVQVFILQDKCPHCHRPYEGQPPDPDKIINEAITQHSQDSDKISRHIKKRFNTETLERL